MSVLRNLPRHGRLTHIKHIPGGKRFWKVGAIYKLKLNNFLMLVSKDNIIQATRAEHRRFNIRHIRRLPPNVKPIVLPKETIVMLLKNPTYMVNITERSDGVRSEGIYEIKVLCNDQVGWISLSMSRSPREYFSRIRQKTIT